MGADLMRAEGARRDQIRRNAWIKTMHQWHWISAALSLSGILLFALTGLTLNHAASIESQAQRSTQRFAVPAAILDALKQAADDSSPGPLPAVAADWISAQVHTDTTGRAVEWSDEELYLALPRPGGDAWLSVDLSTGVLEYELTDRGWIAYFNDLHKGRQTGAVWGAFIDGIALACVVFSLSGLILLQVHAKRRPSTWPLLTGGLALPVLLAVFLLH